MAPQMRSIRTAALIAHLARPVLALVLSFVLVLTRLRRWTVVRLLRALSSLLPGPIRLFTDILRLTTHDSPREN